MLLFVFVANACQAVCMSELEACAASRKSLRGCSAHAYTLAHLMHPSLVLDILMQPCDMSTPQKACRDNLEPLDCCLHT